jgi:hypothetical protein
LNLLEAGRVKVEMPMTATQKQLAGAQSDKIDFYANHCDGLDYCPSPTGTGEGCREQTNFLAPGDVLYSLTPAEIKIVEGK